MKLKVQLAIMAFFVFLFTSNAQVSSNETVAREYIKSHATEFKLKPTDTFKLSFVSKSLVGETLRFQQMMNDVPVYHSEIVVNFNPSNELVFTSDSYESTIQNIVTTPSISKQAALNSSAENLKITGEYTVAENDLVVTKVNNQTKLVYKVVTNPASGIGSWEVLVDAQTGAVLSTKDVAIYHHKKAVSVTNKSTPTVTMAPLAFVTGTAMVYLSDPLSFAQVPYGTTGYVDGNDANTTQLAAARTAVTLPEIDLVGSTYKLKSSYAEIIDFETPTTGLFTQASSAFNFTRDNNAFEAVNVFYHIDRSMRFINETLGITLRPTQNSGIVKFDPSGLSGDDNSHYIPSSDQLAFGEGCVDDAEDADVIWHELGHGLHDWLTNGSTSAFLGEGSSDYWAQSYSRSLNQWTLGDPDIQYMFSWDGHNECWNGRTTDYPAIYPSGLVGLQGGAAHTDGQVWATALMQIWDEIGREKTDKAFLEGLRLTNSATNQQNAARAVRQAAINMNFPCADIDVMTQRFSDRGYVMPALTLSMVALPNISVQAGAVNTYALPSYINLTNAIKDNCDAVVTQSPAMGTVLAPGVHTVTMTATSGASVVNRPFTLTVTTNLGIEDSVKNNFILYPNPANNVLNIKGEFDANESVTIYNMLGQVVLNKAVTSTEESIDIATLASGIYTITFNSAKVSKKFIKN